MKSAGASRDGKGGTLYVVSTPIGNLEDITVRALRILQDVRLIAAEGVRHSQALLRHYGIKTPLTGYNQHNQRVRGPKLLGRIAQGWDIALITNAGTPGISDPGALLVNQAMEKGFRVSPIPGPSAVTAALSVAGQKNEQFLFVGFLPNRAGRRKRSLEVLSHLPYALVFFESPHRLQAMLIDLEAVMGDRRIVLFRELTKIHEEVRAGTVSRLLGEMKDRELKGEIVLVLEGIASDPGEGAMDGAFLKRLEVMLQQEDMSLKDIARQFAEENGLPYRQVYRACLDIRKARPVC